MVHEIAAQLNALGATVHVHEPEVTAASPNSGGTSARKPGGKRFRRLRNLLWFAKTIAHDRRAVAADLEAVRAFRPDVVVARHDAYRGSLIRASHICGVPVVVYADAPVAHETRHWSDDSPAARRFHPPGLVEFYERRHLAMAQAIVAVSEPGKACLEAYGLSVPITVIRNGVDGKYLRPLFDPDERRRRRVELGLSSPFVVGFVGTFKPFHGIDLLESLVHETAAWPDVRWLFVGDGPRKADLMRRLGDSSANVVDLGRQPSDRLPELYRLMDIAVAPYPPSRWPFHFCPLKILEAEASGAVVVASDRGDIPALLGDGQFGVVVTDDSARTWAAEIRRLLDDPSRLQALASGARIHVENRHTWRNSALKLLKMLNALVAGS
jgi:glycosyltransferase involved in cell wall biosynthesis